MPLWLPEKRRRSQGLYGVMQKSAQNNMSHENLGEPFSHASPIQIVQGSFIWVRLRNALAQTESAKKKESEK